MHYAQYMETVGKTTEWLLSNTVTQCYFLPCSSTKNVVVDDDDRSMSSKLKIIFELKSYLRGLWNGI
jgi:hypothetical protein